MRQGKCEGHRAQPKSDTVPDGGAMSTNSGPENTALGEARGPEPQASPPQIPGWRTTQEFSTSAFFAFSQLSCVNLGSIKGSPLAFWGGTPTLYARVEG